MGWRGGRALLPRGLILLALASSLLASACWRNVSGMGTAHAASTSRLRTASAPPPVPPAAPPTPDIPLQLGEARFSLFVVNPRFTTQNVEFTLSRSARVWVEIKRQGDGQVVRKIDLATPAAGTLV